MTLSVEISIVLVYLTMGIGIISVAAGFNGSPESLSYRRFGVFLLVALIFCLNIRYGIEDTGQVIAYFNGIYDPLYNFPMPSKNVEQHPGLIPCLDDSNACSVLEYELHASWAVCFHHRFTNAAGAAFNRVRLNAHIAANTSAFVLALVQFLVYTRKNYLWIHKTNGWLTTILATCGTLSSLWLGSEHHTEDLYGNSIVVYGWYSMGATVLGTLSVGIFSILNHDVAAHEIWMYRWYGSMWGASVLFRIIFLFGSLFRWHKVLMIHIAVYVSAPLGVALLEWIRIVEKNETKKESSVRTQRLKQS